MAARARLPGQSRDEHAVIGKYRYLNEQRRRTVAVVYLAIDQTRAEVRHPAATSWRRPASRSCIAAGAPAQHAELRLRRAQGRQQQGRLPVLHRRHEQQRVDGPGDGRHRLQAEVRGVLHALRHRTSSSSPAARPRARHLDPLAARTRRPAATPQSPRFIEWMGRVAPELAARHRSPPTRGPRAKAFFDALDGAARADHPRGAARPAARKTGTYDAGGFFGPIQLGAEAHQRLRRRHDGRGRASGSA